MPHYTKKQLAEIIKQLKAIAVDGTQVFRVSIINAGTDRPISIEKIRGSGVVNLRIENVTVLTLWVEVEDHD